MTELQLVEIELNDKKLLVSPERTILEVAEKQGCRIPTLCHDPRLLPYASCWICGKRSARTVHRWARTSKIRNAASRRSRLLRTARSTSAFRTGSSNAIHQPANS